LPWGEILEEEAPSLSKQHELLRELRRVNTESERSVLALFTGPPGSSKSWTLGRLISTLDPRYIPSLQNHPVYTRTKSTATKCHLSITLIPFLQAVVEEMLARRDGRQGDLPPGTWWHVDEPTDALSIEWWKQTAKILGKFLMRNSYLRINIGMCCQIKGKTLSYIRELSNCWVRMRRRGDGTVYKMETRINYESVTRGEYIKPRGLWKIRDQTPPPDDWKKLYGPIKDAHAIEGALEDILELRKMGDQVLNPELSGWIDEMKKKMSYVG
jgi:hypothetical protein